MITKELNIQGLTGKLGGLEMGVKDGIPLVGVHGWLDNAASFIPLANEMNQFRWICLDMPGHGKSESRPKGSVYHFTDYIADLYRALDSLQLDRCDLVGHSLGAGICATFAATFPERVNRLILIDGIGPISGDDDDSLEQLRKSMGFLKQESKEGGRWYPSWDDLIIKRMAAGEIEKHSVEMLLSRGAQRSGDSAKVLSDSRLKQHSPIYMNQEKVLSILSGIEAETLFIGANQGLVAERKSTVSRIKAIRKITVENVQGAHHVHLDDPKIVAAPILRFLQSTAV
jgi:pimeloyl-ACP methyl ester carboxylesterase